MPPHRSAGSKGGNPTSEVAHSQVESELETPRKLRNIRKKPSNNSGTTRRPRGGGKLRMLPEMPLDILFEIFGLLEPLDVLRLARTTKPLRNVLMHRSAISIWKQAFSNDLLPECPKDLSEPQYANLAYSEHCHYCLSPGAHTLLWVFRVRSCGECIRKHFGKPHELKRKLRGGPILDHMDLLCQYYHQSSPFIYSDSEAVAVNRRLIELRNNEEGLSQYIEERRKTIEELQSHAAACLASGPLRERRRLLAIQEMRRRRQETICRRLTDLGFGEEIKSLDAIDPEILSEHELISGTRELTDYTWNKIMPPLVEFMEIMREKLQKKQRKSLLKKRQLVLVAVLKQFFLTRPPTETTVSAADICNMPEVKTMLEDTHADVEITKESFADLLKRLPQICDEWRQNKSRELLALMPASSGAVEDFSRLELATTYFQCNACAEPISYPRILEHGCMTALPHGYRNREDDMALIFLNLHSEPWNYTGNKVKYHQAAEASARSVIASSGLDANVATASDLDSVNQWLECLHCSHRVRGRAVFRWQKAILHDIYHAVSEGRSTLWMRLDKEDATAASRQEDALHLIHRGHDSDYSCIRCRERMSLPVMNWHVRSVHGIQDVKREDYRLHIDASMDQPPFPVTIPYERPKEVEFIDMTQDDDNSSDGSPELEYRDVPKTTSEGKYIVIVDD